MDVGAQLREAREARGLSVAALAATTRINARVLEAIERNDLSAIPPPPYARGFVSTYAREVGLAPHDTVRSFFAQFAPSPPANHAAARVGSVSPSFQSISDRTDRARSWMPAAVVLFVAASAFVLWMSGRATGREPGAVGTSGTPAADSSGAALPADSSGSVVPTASGAATPASALAVATSGTTTAARAGASSSAAAPASAPAALVVTLETDGSSWITATADGQRAVYRILPSGTKETLRASRELTIRVGNAGAVRWSVNGRQPVAMGRRGEVKTVTLTPASAAAIR